MAKESGAQNLKGLMANGRTRVIILLTASVIVGISAIGLMGMKKTKNAADQGSVQTAQAPSAESVPGTSTSDAYNQLQAEENRKKARDEQNQGATTFLPVVTAPVRDNKTPIQLPDAPVRENQPVRQRQIVTKRVVYREPPRLQPVVDKQLVADMKAKMQSALDAGAPSEGLSETNFTQQSGQDSSSTAGYGVAAQASRAIQQTAGMASGQGAASESSDRTQQAGASFVKAGTIIPAVLLTSINTDTPGPILAEIVSGPLKGSRLLGAFAKPSSPQAQKVVLSFTKLVMPKIDHSFSVSTFAVDPSADYSSSLASSVDNHYLQKYGLLFAAAFVTGYGNAAATPQTTSVIPTTGGATTLAQPPTSTQAKWAGLASVGSQMSSDMSAYASIPPTITVDAGIPIGILFMADF